MADQLDKSLPGDIDQLYELIGGPVQISDIAVVENRDEAGTVLGAGCWIRFMKEEDFSRPSTYARHFENVFDTE